MFKRRCKICKYFQKGYGQYRSSEKELFEKKCRENESLRELAKYLEYSCRLRVSYNLVRSHIKNCLPKDITTQRETLKEIQEANKSLKKRIKSFFFRGKTEAKVECKHNDTYSWFERGLVWTKCKGCQRILGTMDPQRRGQDSWRKAMIILEALRNEQ